MMDELTTARSDEANEIQQLVLDFAFRWGLTSKKAIEYIFAADGRVAQ